MAIGSPMWACLLLLALVAPAVNGDGTSGCSYVSGLCWQHPSNTSEVAHCEEDLSGQGVCICPKTSMTGDGLQDGSGCIEDGAACRAGYRLKDGVCIVDTCYGDPCRFIDDPVFCEANIKSYVCICIDGGTLINGECSNACDGLCTMDNEKCVVRKKNPTCVCVDGTDRIDTECIVNTLCENVTCSENEKCAVRQGKAKCVCLNGYERMVPGGACVSPPEPGVCGSWGDPHVTTFDGLVTHFQGQCEHVLTRDNCAYGRPAGKPDLEISYEGWKRDYEGSAEISWIKEVTVQYLHKTISLMQGKEVRVNNEAVSLPASVGSGLIVILYAGYYVEVHLTDGTRVQWDGMDHVEIKVPVEKFGQMCGICGDYNGDDTDDLVVGPRCPAKEGQQTDNYNLQGHSWSLDSCTPDCNPEPPINCSAEETAEHFAKCNSVLHDKFLVCTENLELVLVQKWNEACMFEMCLVSSNESRQEESLCEFSAMVAEKCARMAMPVNDWQDNFCDVTCPGEMVYRDCGPPCPETCPSDQIMESILCSDQECQAGCFCPPGLLHSNQNCVEPKTCGCTYNGQYIENDERFIIGDCEQECTCEGGVVNCDVLSCHQFATCNLQNGVKDCLCNTFYTGDGRDCTANCDDYECPGNERCDTEFNTHKCVCDGDFQYDISNDCVPLCYDADCNSNEHCNPETHQCVCDNGFTSDINGDCVPVCNDADCNSNEHCDPETHQCVCDNGFTSDINGDCVLDCVDPCGQNEICKLVNNAPTCMCRHHYTRKDNLCVGVCENMTCSRPLEHCKVVHGMPECRCPRTCPTLHSPVCALFGGQQKTFKNRYIMRHKACVQDTTFELLHKGACKEPFP